MAGGSVSLRVFKRYFGGNYALRHFRNMRRGGKRNAIRCQGETTCQDNSFTRTGFAVNANASAGIEEVCRGERTIAPNWKPGAQPRRLQIRKKIADLFLPSATEHFDGQNPIFLEPCARRSRSLRESHKIEGAKNRPQRWPPARTARPSQPRLAGFPAARGLRSLSYRA